MKEQDMDQLLKQGEDLFASGDLPEAEEFFRQILDLTPLHIQALNNIGVIFFMRSDFINAMDYFNKALEIDELYPEAIENYSKCLIAMGKALDAGDFIQKSLKLGLLNNDLINVIKECYIDSGNIQSIEHVANQSISTLDNNISNKAINTSVTSKERINVGFVSIWFERGQSYVTKALRDAINHKNNTHVFARTGGVYGQPKLETGGYWDVPNLMTYPEYIIPPEVIKKWIKDNNLQVIIFNEEYDWKLIQAAKETGAKIITYLDYYKNEWEPYMGLYDMVLCSTHRTYNLVKNVCRAFNIGWCVDLDLFKPRDDINKEYTFFHNAGWLGINYRKMTPAVIVAFDAISKYYNNASLLVHAQAELEKLPPQVVEIVKSNQQINYHVETLPAPGFYNKGKILVFPSKLEGLGLPLPEGMACGLPAIASDAPPMNEFVKDGYNGFLVKIANRITRDDNISFPEEIIDINDLAVKMSKAIKNPDLINEMGLNARHFAETEFNPTVLETKLNNLIMNIIN